MLVRLQPADLSDAVEQALRAPSVHNTQPWQWRIRPGEVELHADWGRHLVATDPDGRDLLLSCGAALHHLRVVLAAAGMVAQVHRLPDPENSAHLATVTVRRGTADDTADDGDAALFAAIGRRRTDRRRMSHHPVPAQHVQSLADQARGASLFAVTDPNLRRRLGTVLGDAAQEQEVSPGYAAELAIWTSRYAGAQDGIPPGNVPLPPLGQVGASPLRLFPRPGRDHPGQPPAGGGGVDAAELLVLTTAGDGPVDRLRAGEAMSAVLLAATGQGLATTPLSQALEVDATRHAVWRDVLHGREYPQIILRVGWPATGAAELPATPRRDLRSVRVSD